ncbi:sugar transferase [Bacillus sp. JJ1562]|uniref:sugar transferase n=1 Tax=Bacillus sp. JJ1562 TaxID=3122960 RepID=UPI0030027549
MLYKSFIKRLIDIVLAVLALIILFPLFLIIIICIKLDSKGPVLFRQLRVGRDKKEFYILKFRTMKVDAPKDMPTFMLENPQQYITKLGSFLRRTSLDELPQIINIIKGEMSIIGPRPVIRNEELLYIERDRLGVYSIKPGLTGLAQINGRDIITVEEKARLDGYYANNCTFVLDLKIFLISIIIVLKSKGIREGTPSGEKTKNSVNNSTL